MPHPYWAVLSSDSSYLSCMAFGRKKPQAEKKSLAGRVLRGRAGDLAGGKSPRYLEVLGIFELAADRITLERMGLLDAEEEY